MTNLPDKPEDSNPGGLPVRLSNRDFELVIRRAAELQARDSEGPGGDGVDEQEVLRIGRELGLSSQHLHRALAEVHGSEISESGVMTRAFGPDSIRVGRAIRGDATQFAPVLENHLVNREYLSVLRRHPDRIVFTRSAGATATVGRAMSKAFNRMPPLDVSNLETTVRQIDEDYTYVSLATTLGAQRTGTAITSIGGGLCGGGTAAAFLGIAVAPVAALGGVPILLAAYYGGRHYYSNALDQARVKMESLLDRLEHGDLTRSKTQPPGFMGLGKPFKPGQER